VAVSGPSRLAGCRSSVVEHSLGKGEVESSILSGSTIQTPCFARVFRFHDEVAPPHSSAERCKNMRLFWHVLDTRSLSLFSARCREVPPFLKPIPQKPERWCYGRVDCRVFQGFTVGAPHPMPPRRLWVPRPGNMVGPFLFGHAETLESGWV
jgi:hypothetical protein